MIFSPRNLKSIYITGILFLILGALDPMELSVIIATGALLTSLAAYLRLDPQKKLFYITSSMIIFGVTMLWIVSSMGGFNPQKEWWWLVILAPYPLGWLIQVGLLIYKWVRKV
jgi:hypothetical protein